MARILLMDADQTSATKIVLALETSGFDVVASPDGVEGVKQLAASRLDLVIINDALLTIDCWETCSHLRKTSNVPVIMLGSDKSERAVLKALSLGADYYLKKPISIPELVARVHALLRRSRVTAKKG